MEENFLHKRLLVHFDSVNLLRNIPLVKNDFQHLGWLQRPLPWAYKAIILNACDYWSKPQV